MERDSRDRSARSFLMLVVQFLEANTGIYSRFSRCTRASTTAYDFQIVQELNFVIHFRDLQLSRLFPLGVGKFPDLKL
jgi:hypothetical protein